MILLRLNPQGGVAWLRAIFDDLATSATGTTFRLEAQSQVSFTPDLKRLQLQVVASSPARHLQLEGPGAFLWRSTTREWDIDSQFIEPLLHQPGHQYLTSENDDDALVEISVGERHR